MLKVLHLAGSTESELDVRNNLYFVVPRLNHDGYEFFYAVIKPDETWTFTRDLAKYHKGESVDAVTMTLPEAIQHIADVIKPDVGIHHLHCKDGSIYPRFLMEMLHIPLIGSSPQTAIVTKNKAMTSAMMKLEGSVAVPKTVYVNKCLYQDNPKAYTAEEVIANVGLPCIVKAVNIEESDGVFKVNSIEDYDGAIIKALSLDHEILIEEFIVGTEWRSGVIEDETGQLEVLPMIKYSVDPDRIRYKTEDKQSIKCLGSKLQYNFAKFSESNRHELDPIRDASIKLFKALNIRDFGLFDLRVNDKTGVVYLLEVNLYCSFMGVSVLNAMAREAGYTDEQLLNMFIDKAVKRK